MFHQIHPNTIRQILFLLILIIIAFVISSEMYFLLGAFLGAVTLYVLLRNLMFKLVIEYKWKKWLTALSLILASIIIIVLPSIWLIRISIEQIKPLIDNPSLINNALTTIHDYLLEKYKIDILNAENISKLNAQVMPFVQDTIGNTLSALGNVVMMYVLLYFMLVGSNDIERWLRNHVPFKNSNVVIVISEFRKTVYSNAIGIPMVAVAQGLVGLIGYWIFGVEKFILMGLLTGICSVIPVVGSLAIYLPLAIFQIAIGEPFNGVAILLWGFILIGSVDNIARFMIQKKLANVHPLITIFGVIIGINLFGFLGIIFGPLLLSMFVLLVRVYIDEFGKANADEPALPPRT
jgi:predicted PurR-regulated permease PerM